MSRFFIPTQSAENWRAFLAEPERQWRAGFSARTLAYCWETAQGFPTEIDRLFKQSDNPAFEQVELMLAFPEYKVPLPGGRAASQNDLFVLARDHQEQLMTIMVEGKVAEPFGPTLEAWHKADSSGKIERIQFILEQLQLPSVISSDIRYQLLHRTVSVVIEAKRFHAKNAVMIVHSFSQKNQWFEDYQKFVALFEVDAQLNKLVFLKRLGEIDLYSGWATGDERFLNM